jgi:hypothetical protein
MRTLFSYILRSFRREHESCIGSHATTRRSALDGDGRGGVSGSSDRSLHYVQLDAYNADPKMLVDLHNIHLGNISRIVRTQVFSRVKFLPKSGKEHEKIFGSF